jgi:hypothetical protein
MKLRIRKMPRPLDLSRFSGARGFASVSGSLVPHPDIQLGDRGGRRRFELDEDVLARVVLVPVLHRVDHRLPDGDAHPMERIVVEAGSARDVIADHLDEVQHVEVAGEFQTDDQVAVDRHGCGVVASEYHLHCDVKARGVPATGW